MVIRNTTLIVSVSILGLHISARLCKILLCCVLMKEVIRDPPFAKLLILLSMLGVQHSITFVCCDCEPLAETLVRARLWPASPHYPRYAFSFDLLDWAEALLLECQVALKDFCQALSFRCPFKTLKVCDCTVYKSCFDLSLCLVIEKGCVLLPY